jgi:hypothetical protein
VRGAASAAGTFARDAAVFFFAIATQKPQPVFMTCGKHVFLRAREHIGLKIVTDTAAT